MDKSPKVTISMPRSLWHAFRIACVQRNTSASKEIQRFIAEQLAAWQRQIQKEPDRA